MLLCKVNKKISKKKNDNLLENEGFMKTLTECKLFKDNYSYP